jgi:hypothetical protein
LGEKPLCHAVLQLRQAQSSIFSRCQSKNKQSLFSSKLRDGTVTCVIVKVEKIANAIGQEKCSYIG